MFATVTEGTEAVKFTFGGTAFGTSVMRRVPKALDAIAMIHIKTSTACLSSGGVGQVV